MLPKKELNIYPKNKENLTAILNFYFDKLDFPLDNSIEILVNKSSLSLNQIEFIARKVSESYETVFRQEFKNGTTISNLLRHAIEGLTKPESEWNFPPTSKSRLMTRNFIRFVADTETNYSFLETNN
jgi:hypothetical protein